MQWLQDPDQSKLVNLNDVRRETIRHFRNKEKNIWELNWMNLELRVRKKKSENCLGTSMTLRRNRI